jgi:opacity protein-like surface antigen
MKKYFIASVFILSAAFLSAEIEGNIETYAGTALFSETSDMNGPETDYKSASASLGVSGGVYFNDFIGIKAYFNFLVPWYFSARPDGQPSMTRADYDFLLGLDEFVGVVFNVYKTEKLTIPLLLGFHGKLFFSTVSDYFTTATNSGVGIGIGLEYSFSENWYFLARLNGSFDFLGFSVKTPSGNSQDKGTHVDMDFIRTWGIAPHLGLGYRF